MTNEGKYHISRCCRKHMGEVKKSKTSDFDFTCSHCMKHYHIKRIKDVELGAGAVSWSHPQIITARKKAS